MVAVCILNVCAFILLFVDKQDPVERESEQRTDKLEDELGGVEVSPRQPPELSSSSSSEDIPGSAVRQSMLASAMLDTSGGGREEREGEPGEGEGEGVGGKEQDEWVIVGEGKAPSVGEH